MCVCTYVYVCMYVCVCVFTSISTSYFSCICGFFFAFLPFIETPALCVRCRAILSTWTIVARNGANYCKRCWCTQPCTGTCTGPCLMCTGLCTIVGAWSSCMIASTTFFDSFMTIQLLCIIYFVSLTTTTSDMRSSAAKSWSCASSPWSCSSTRRAWHIDSFFDFKKSTLNHMTQTLEEFGSK